MERKCTFQCSEDVSQDVMLKWCTIIHKKTPNNFSTELQCFAINTVPRLYFVKPLGGLDPFFQRRLRLLKVR